MEHKHAKAYRSILKLLPKATVNFQNPLYSPSREKRSDPHHHMINCKHKTHMGKGFSGSVTSMSLVPAEALRNLKNNNDQSPGNQEPTSPKISCMGQIKHKHKKKFDKANSFSVAKEEEEDNIPKEVSKKHPSMFKRMFTMSSNSKPAARKSFDPALQNGVPDLSQMKRFASGREAFASFDWTAQQVAPETDEEQDEDGFITPFSAPTAVVKGVALHPRKEVNLWKRRTLNPPAPLQLDQIVNW